MWRGRHRASDAHLGDQAVIDRIEERKTLLYRSDQYKSKLLAANLTQLFIVVATEPGFADDLISRSLVAADAAGIEARIILNKTDVTARWRDRERLLPYSSLGYPVMKCRRAPSRNMPWPPGALLAGQSSILIGQSGMGKSSLINLLVPDADIAVREISAALTRASTRPPSRACTLDELGANSSIIDSPGFQEFGLYHLSEGMLERACANSSPTSAVASSTIAAT
jgi:ribosome biogenesis GTPase